MFISCRKLKKGSSKAEQIYKSAPDYCEVKIICNGKEVAMTDWMTIPSLHSDPSHGKIKDNEQENKNSVSCICFMRKFMSSSSFGTFLGFRGTVSTQITYRYFIKPRTQKICN